MKRHRPTLALLLVAIIALAPALAEARAGSRAGSYRGGGSYSSRSGSMSSPSVGSRGSRTYDSNSARPIERSTTPAPYGARPGAAPSSGYATAGGAGPGFFQRHPILSGIAGGFVGSWLGGMLFGHSAAVAAPNGAGTGSGDFVEQGRAASPGGSLFGSLLPFLLLFGLGWLGFRLFRRPRDPALATASHYEGVGGSSALPPVAHSAIGGPAPAITQQDEADFADILARVQDNWSKGDMDALKLLVTPEMLGYFREALANNVSQGVENRVEQVRPLDLEVREAWSEGGLDYVTAAMTWSAVDYTFRLDRKPADPDYLFDGSPDLAEEVSEVWTLVRSPGGRWVLSAIQQV